MWQMLWSHSPGPSVRLVDVGCSWSLKLQLVHERSDVNGNELVVGKELSGSSPLSETPYAVSPYKTQQIQALLFCQSRS